MMELQPIETAPKDGTWVLLFGGDTGESDLDRNDQHMRLRPVVGCWLKDEFWYEARWVWCRRDCKWRDEYSNPTHWLALDSLQIPPAQMEDDDDIDLTEDEHIMHAALRPRPAEPVEINPENGLPYGRPVNPAPPEYCIRTHMDAAWRAKYSNAEN